MSFLVAVDIAHLANHLTACYRVVWLCWNSAHSLPLRVHLFLLAHQSSCSLSSSCLDSIQCRLFLWLFDLKWLLSASGFVGSVCFFLSVCLFLQGLHHYCLAVGDRLVFMIDDSESDLHSNGVEFSNFFWFKLLVTSIV